MQYSPSINYISSDQQKNAGAARLEGDFREVHENYFYGMHTSAKRRVVSIGLRGMCCSVNADNDKYVGEVIVADIVGRNVINGTFKKQLSQICSVSASEGFILLVRIFWRT